ncbi:TPA: hypothetical protein I9Y23_000809 [Kluyvera ascorbata]|uniref:PilN domain-containing protein n=1 Tax=Enterobacteriaceae TaxID=543 RepID=UPI0011B295BE|nr:MULTISPECIES: hypothetical protein [Enterobacteriaceae]HAT3917218.1 hypothetical protein [Kluyvera ascorbata]BBQ81896.1 pilus assembly protein PilN [Klebsiella sp. WP3-W18-ESBL-02]BBR18899.1 pilus assembly protein PilN [Klebsiella sp. WP3-S18-ESBL-05]HAT3942131.1 hypothetical protein [Kluyvera ascorbata]HAT3947779.1 hypothetical protein [Kluyvera ascorbata]
MAIVHTVNFLPWRRARFYRHLRRWVAGVAACWLLSMAVAFSCQLSGKARRAGDDIHADAERQITQQLAAREREWAARAQQQALLAQRLAHRRTTEAWAARLSTLAEQLPPQAWLNELVYRERTLLLSGTLIQFAALAGVEQVLTALPGFQPATAGKIQRDNAGRWQVHYQLQEETDDAAP